MNEASTSVRLTGSLLAEGRSSRSLHRAVGRGELVRLRYGAYTGGLPTDERMRHLQLIEATLPRLAPRAVLSHRSAALLHGLPVWSEGPTRVHITRERSSGGRRSRHLWVHTGPLDDADVIEIDGLSVTGLGRTVADLGRTLPLDRAVAAADAGLRQGLDRIALRSEVHRSERRRGARQLRFVVDFADGRAESPGESFSRLLMFQVRLPKPTLQYEVLDPDTGAVIGYCDFGWAEHRTVGEFDGRVKYGRLLEPEQHPGDVVFAEKQREDSVRDTGLEMARWTMPDLGRPRLFRERIQRAFDRAARFR